MILTHSSEVPEKVLADDGGLVGPPVSAVSPTRLSIVLHCWVRK